LNKAATLPPQQLNDLLIGLNKLKTQQDGELDSITIVPDVGEQPVDIP